MSPFTFCVKATDVLDSMTAIKMRDDMENERRERFIREQEEQMAAQLGVDTTMIETSTKLA
jgi:hypothetical protein